MAIRFGDLTIGCKSTALFCRCCCTFVQLPPDRLATTGWWLTAALIGDSKMERYIPLTGIDLVPASLLIDSEAPLDVLQAMADYRIRTVTQVLENIAFRGEVDADCVVLSDFAQLLAIPLRDGCDLMDVIGRRLRKEASEVEVASAATVS